MLTDYKPKLIEVALPLVAINDACAQEKTVKHGHPSNLHLYWARRPLAAARAVLWASLVDDPSVDSADDETQEKERARLFMILSRLVRWENSGDEQLLKAARAEIARCYPDGLPTIVDPFGGGGAIAIEANRLGLPVVSADINPVAVLIQRAVVEIPRRFRGCSQVSPGGGVLDSDRTGTAGLAADVHYYGLLLRDEAAQALRSAYPTVTDSTGRELEPLAWIWARTVASPDPSWGAPVPLVGSWILSKKPGKPVVWIEPSADRATKQIRYEVRSGGTPSVGKTIEGGVGTCLATGATIPADYIKSEAIAGRLGRQLIAVVADGPNGRVFLAPTEAQEAAARAVVPPPETVRGAMSTHPQYMGTPRYGLDEWWKLFTERQLLALETLSNGLSPLREKIESDAVAGGYPTDGVRLHEGGSGATAYADAVVTYLALTIDKLADLGNSLCRWEPVAQCPRQLFGRQAVSMVWDFAEGNPFGRRSGSFEVLLDGQRRVLGGRGLPASTSDVDVVQRDARASISGVSEVVVSTDPPYYDAVPYADISDFFYVWLRRSLADVWPDECATLLTPKSEEMVADYQRHGSREGAEQYFETSMASFMQGVATAQRSDVPATIYYAYKASEGGGSTGSTGWSTFLTAVLDAGMQVTATWPLRTENASRLRAMKSNALASSVVLTCRPRRTSASMATRGEFISALRDELPDAVRLLQSGNIAPVDLAQSTIGPGIKVFSRYSKVVEANGQAMTVTDALAIINDVLGEVLDGEEAELDADTRFATTWYAQNGYNPGRAGDADNQARAKNTSLAGLHAAGIGEARGGTFRLFERGELNPAWDPVTDSRRTVWEATQHLVAALDRSETEAAELLHRMGGYSDRARQLAYVLFQKATDKGWAEEAGAYNGLITAWPTLQSIGAGGSDAQQQLL